MYWCCESAKFRFRWWIPDDDIQQVNFSHYSSVSVLSYRFIICVISPILIHQLFFSLPTIKYYYLHCACSNFFKMHIYTLIISYLLFIIIGQSHFHYLLFYHFLCRIILIIPHYHLSIISPFRSLLFGYFLFHLWLFCHFKKLQANIKTFLHITTSFLPATSIPHLCQLIIN